MALIQINTLWSLEKIRPIYYFNTESLQVINSANGYIKTVYLGKRGYPVVFLERSEPTKKGRMRNNVPMHKIVALAMINNGPYELIEHLDDNPLNYDPINLKFSNHKNNYDTAKINGKVFRDESKFELCLLDGTIYTGTMRQISEKSEIPRGTLYDRLYNDKPNKKWNIHYIKQIYESREKSHASKFTKLNNRDSNGFMFLNWKRDIRNRSTD